MKLFLKSLTAGVIGLVTLGLTAASADYRPDRCYDDHDHRSHAANYYDYYDHDRYYRAGPYRSSGVTFSVRVGDKGYRDRRYRDRHYDRRYHRGHRRGSEVIRRDVFQTRYRARIVLVEEIRYGRRHPRKVCTVSVRGPEARYVPDRRLRRVANRHCSRNARIRIYA